MSKEVATTKLTLTTEQRESAIKRIQKGLAGVERGSINIAADVAKLAEAAAPDREPKRLQLSWNAETDADGKKLIKAMQEAKAMHYDFVEVTVL